MGLFDLLRKNKELEQMYDLDLIDSTSERIQQKKLAVQTCVDFIGRTISQSEFRIRKDKKTVKDEMYYKLNVRPNQNQSAAIFWQTVIHKLIHDTECLIIKSDTDDLLIADDYNRIEYGLVEDLFKDVTINNFTFQRTFPMSEVIFIEYSNVNLSRLIDTVYDDYGELIGRLLEFQKHKNQIRATVDVSTTVRKDEDGQNPLQKFIDKLYGSIKTKAFAIVPQQQGFKYEEHSKGAVGSGQSVEDVTKATNDFMNQVAKALGIPPSLIHGEMADVEKQTRNFMFFCIDPIIEKISDELNNKFIEKKDYLNGENLEVVRPSYRDIFDLATAIDKIIATGVMNGDEMRDKFKLPETGEEIHSRYVMTKNYSEVVESNEESQER
ncbi:phage portal protein [Oceanobacillus sp. FSL W7-1293]|uniref:phage portal protein n=1 Tax=Oceanobacillus sp. FSL W7-1293 TaxID=2921699 RepID=UPI0030D11B08